MGDGAVVCMPSQQQPIAERFPVSEASWGGRVFGCAPEKKMKETQNTEQHEDPDDAPAKEEELENGEFVPESKREQEQETNGELENGEFVPEMGLTGELEMGEFVPDEWERLEDKLEHATGSGRMSEFERGEIVPDKGRRGDRQNSQDDHYRRKDSEHGNWEKGDFGRGRRQRGDRRGRTPDNHHRRREGRSRIDSEPRKRSSLNCESVNNDVKHENSNGKHHGRDSSTRSQRKPSTESESSSRKHHGEFSGNSASKTRRISEENSCRSGHQDKSHSSSTISTRNSSSSRYSSSRRSPLPSRAHDRHARHVRSDRSPGSSEKSPHSRTRHRDHRQRTPSRRDRSPHDRARSHDLRNRTAPINSERSPLNSEKHQGRSSRRDISARESSRSSRSVKSDKEKSLQLPPPPPPPSPPPLPPPPPPANGFLEDHHHHHHHHHHHSMEEDMDISDTPPHHPNTLEQSSGKWYYLDEFGLERGPSKLDDLKRLVEGGVLPSDHLIKHLDSNRWVTVENAASPSVPVNLTSIVSDAVTQMVCPPEAPGNMSTDAADAVQEDLDHLESPEDFHIDERVEALLDGIEIIPGREVEIIGEALKATFEHIEWENFDHSEGFTRCRSYAFEIPRPPEGFSRDGFAPNLDKDPSILSSDSTDLFAGRWSCKGGDWRRNDDNAIDRCQKRKLVLNEGFPLCQMPKSGEDPRRHGKDELYISSSDKKLDLPTWAFSWNDDKNESNGRVSQTKIPAARGVKGIMLPVLRINACVARESIFSPEPQQTKAKPIERQHRSSRPHNTGSEKNSRTDVASSHSKKAAQSDNRSSIVEVENIKIHKNRTHTIDELSVNTGGWYYLDGAGHEHGPALFSELQDLVAKGAIISNSSVFRKTDNIWVPVTVGERASKGRCAQDERRSKASRSTPPFNSLYPQYVGYMRGKLHELVMRSYKSREFAVAIHEVLDPWISAKQPKKELEKHFPFNSSISKSSAVLSRDAPSERFWSNTDGDGSGSYGHVGKRARLLLDESDEDREQDVPSSFEELWGEQVADEQTISMRCSENSWGLLSSPILARIFHFLRADVKSFHVSSATCKHWRATAQSYKNVSRHIDLSSLGPSCTDSMLQSIMRGCDKRNVSSLTLSKCTNVSAPALEEILQSFTSIASIDIRGCNQFKELTTSFQNVKWIRSRSFQNMKILEESSSKTRSLRWITDKSLKEMGGDGGELTGSRDSAVPTFRQGYYKRTRLPDARKSTSALTRHAQLRQLLRKKSVTAYKKMEEFIGIRLKEIMKGNTFECFVPRVAEIEDRIRNGYYARRGLSCVKEDISRMCRDALKAKKKGDSGEMRHAIMLFFQLAKRLEDSKASHKKVESSSRSSKERLESGLSEGSRHKKKSSHKKGASRGSRSTNGGPDIDSAAVDQEVRRSVPKASRRHVDSGSETSEENDRFTECDTVSDSDGRTSDTESELDSQLEGSRTEDGRESTVTWDDSLDDREWGARMTKASLVPPVTRKYEVIDQYLVVADEEEVKRKMAVALPEDYEEKLRAQKSGLDETDMQIPEVKEYKPRKTLGDEVIEQEVYGIDPYTHNLLLDSMPEEADWPLVEKQNFIEEVLLRVLNKQTRHLTGFGNTPMVYHLKPVVEEIKRTAEGGDSRLVKLSNAILKAMQSRPDDNYVAYRKGLGVVCNKEGGFGDDDFVVEFLGEVYPAWKWFEKQDGIRSLQKNNKDPAPEFYNIYLERPKGDRDGYDLVVVDAMHKANYASRICHSCRPNCEAKVTAVDGQYQIGIYAVRPIAYGEEITFDYNSVTESKEEYEASVCLCGSQVCRGSYLNLTGEDAFHNVLKECHGLLDRHRLMLEACEAGFVSQEDYVDLGRAGLGTCLLDGLPDWLIAYSARLVRFMNFERTKLPEEILKHNVEEKKKFFTDVCIETEKIEAENQAEGVYNQRLQNLALTLDKVRYVMRCAFGDPKRAPPPLERLSPEELVAAIWTAEDSLVDELLRCLASHLQAPAMDELRSKVRARAPSGPDLPSELKKSLLWLRDELRTIPCTQRCRVDAAADLIHLYAYTKCFFRVREYKAVESPPVYISPLDLGPKYVEKMGAGFQEYCKRYGENYCLGQLIFWHNQTSAEPDAALARARRGCLALPDLSSSFPPDFPPPLYGPRTLRFVLSRMEKQPQRPWPKDQIWQFRSSPRLLGTPMLDAVLAGGGQPLDRDMIHWLRSRPSLFDLA